MRVAVSLLMLVGVLVGVTQGSSARGLLPRSASLLDQEDTMEKRQQDDDLAKKGRLDDKKILRDVVKTLWILAHEDDSDNEQNDAKRQILNADTSALEHNRFKRSPAIGAVAAIISAIAASVSAASSIVIATGGGRGNRYMGYRGRGRGGIRRGGRRRGGIRRGGRRRGRFGRGGLQQGIGEADTPLDDWMADRISTLNNDIKRSLSTFNKVANDGQRRKRQSGADKLDIFGNPVFEKEIERLNKAGLLNRDDFDILLEEESNLLRDQ